MAFLTKALARGPSNALRGGLARPWHVVACVCANQSLRRHGSSDSAASGDDGPSRPPTTTASSGPRPGRAQIDVAALLSRPTWSVRSLLPPDDGDNGAPAITPRQLHHLLRLSALPLPSSPAEEASLLAGLRQQLGFVRQLRETALPEGLAPLAAVRDETLAAVGEAAFTVDDVEEVLRREVVVGRNRRPRRRKGKGEGRLRVSDGDSGGGQGGREVVEKDGALGRQEALEDWDVLGNASKRVQRYFVVETRKG